MWKVPIQILCLILLVGGLCGIPPSHAAEISVLENPVSSAPVDPSVPVPEDKPIQSYSLPLITAAAKQKVKIDPPAAWIVVTTKPGDVSVYCGDSNQKHYRCVSGKPLQISYDPPQPISFFWAYSEHAEHVALKIDVYELFDESANQPLDGSETDEELHSY